MSVNPPNINNINFDKIDLSSKQNINEIKRNNLKEEILINNIDELVNLLVDKNYDIESKIKSIGYDINDLIEVDDLDIVELIMQIEKDLDVSISDNIIDEFNGFLKKVYSMIVSKRRDKKLDDLGIN
jgi:acyl carrier protein